MSVLSTSRRRWRRVALATAGASLIATISPLLSPLPAGAVTAPLVTTDGVGIRVDENAILGPALEEIENAIQPFANTMIYNGALANSPAGTPKSLQVSHNTELGFDFVNAGTAGYPQGGLKVHADLQNIVIRYIKDPVWPFADCSIWVRPDNATIDASAYIDSSKLPAAPLTLNPISAYWDADPAVSSDGVCWWWLIDDFFDSIFSSGGSNSIADNIETELNGQAQTLIDDLWADYVTPVITSLNEFGITLNTIKTDDHGLIVTANMDATAGIMIPGDTSGLPRPVANAQDSGATSNVDTLLATRASDAIVTIHPNVANQFLFGLRGALAGQFGGPAVASTIESVLLDPLKYGDYADAGWTVSLSTPGTTNAPYLFTPGGGVAPTVKIDNMRLTVRNTSKGTSPVATFEGPAANILLDTIVRPAGTTWGPAYDASSMTATLARTQGNADVVAFNGAASGMLPYAKQGVDYFDEAIFQGYVSLAPISLGTLDVDVCTACAQYSGDERYTETFIVS
jgi:hypothetical protein